MSAESPLGRSTDTIGMPITLTSATTVSSSPVSGDAEAGADNRVHDERAALHLGGVQLPALLVVHFHHADAEAAQDVEVDARVALDLRHRGEQEHRDVHAALRQRAGDHEAVAAVVALAAQHRHAAGEPVLVGGLDGRHHLAAGVLHQHERGEADVFDRLAIGLAHLRGVQDPHQAYASTGGQVQTRLRSPNGLSTRPTAGQNLCARTNGSGYAASSRE